MALLWTLLVVVAVARKGEGQRGVPPVGSEYNDVRVDGSYQFGFQTGDRGQHYQAAAANSQNQVSGRFGSLDPAKKTVVNTEWTAGRRGFRARGPNIARKMDLSQAKIPYNPPVSPGSPNYNPTYDGYHDPNEDPTYSYTYRTPTSGKQEASDSLGHVNGKYYFYDDVGERHDVAYEAGARIGFNVKTPFPDSKVFTGLFYRGADGKPGGNPRGKTSILQRLDGSYRFVAAGPDQRRTEQSDSVGNVRGSYTYVDDKGQQRTVEYIAGPGIGYRIVKKGTGASFPSIPSFIPPISPSVTIPPFPSNSPIPFPPIVPDNDGISDDYDSTGRPGAPPFGGNRPSTAAGSGGRPGGSSFGQDVTGPDAGTGTGSGESGPGSTATGSGGDKETTGPPSWSTTESSPGGSSWSTTTSGSSSWTTPPPPSGTWGSGTTKPSGGSGPFKPPPSFGGDEDGYPPVPPLYKPPPTSLYPSSGSTFSSPSTTGGGSSTTEQYPGYPDSEGYPSGRPKPGSPTFSLPNNCCRPGPPPPLNNPPSAFPEDDPNNQSKKPPKPTSPEDFLQAPFEDFPPKEFNGPNYYRPRPIASSSTSGLQVGDNTFLSSNKNYFSFPAGVAVRAHIQSLDILPFGSRIPSPGAALEAGASKSARR